MTWSTLMPGVYAGAPGASAAGAGQRPRPSPAAVRARQNAHLAGRRRELLASEIPHIAPGEHWCCCCGETCGPEGECLRCGRECPNCDGHYTVRAVERLIPGEYVPTA